MIMIKIQVMDEKETKCIFRRNETQVFTKVPGQMQLKEYRKKLRDGKDRFLFEMATGQVKH